MLKLFAIKDKKSTGLSSPFAAVTIGLAERQVKDLITNPQTEYGRYTEDYSLWSVGEYDENTGELIPGKPAFLCECTTLKPQS